MKSNEINDPEYTLPIKSFDLIDTDRRLKRGKTHCLPLYQPPAIRSKETSDECVEIEINNSVLKINKLSKAFENDAIPEKRNREKTKKPDIQVYIPKAKRFNDSHSADSGTEFCQELSNSNIRKEKKLDDSLFFSENNMNRCQANFTSADTVYTEVDDSCQTNYENHMNDIVNPLTYNYSCNLNNPETEAYKTEFRTEEYSFLPNSDIPHIIIMDDNGVNNLNENKSKDINFSLSQLCKSDNLDVKVLNSFKEFSESNKNVSPIKLWTEEVESWETLYNDSSTWLTTDAIEEITSNFGKVNIEHPQFDYSSYLEQNSSYLDDHFGHVIEIYNFPIEFRTEDLMIVFSRFQNHGFKIHWVDDTHALGVFSSSAMASEALAISHPIVKLRPLSQATSESKIKAKRISEFLKPYKPRPETTAILARRLVSGALGLRIHVSNEQKAAELQQLKIAKEKRKQITQLKESAWEGYCQCEN